MSNFFLKKLILFLLSLSILFQSFMIWFGLGMTGAFVNSIVPESILFPILMPIFAIQNILILFQRSISKKINIWISVLPLVCISSTIFWRAFDALFLMLRAKVPKANT
ncbi:hypothetical protein CH362_14905 [Leptospira saintgironsiae]|uniref:Uncharacterized protein n=1 Tax=Leptospira saintgironsiae TaxID=2023183 RepID=A0A2M9YA79_9LEPT|nr:hypothetical protein CH362_14905 [Leptospira saintgironsiae]